MAPFLIGRMKAVKEENDQLTRMALKRGMQAVLPKSVPTAASFVVVDHHLMRPKLRSFRTHPDGRFARTAGCHAGSTRVLRKREKSSPCELMFNLA